jgi:ankyrin repeat protein
MHRCINEKYEGVGTPLHVAAYRGDLAIVQLLLQKGASLHTRGNFGLTPLEVACQEGKEAVVRLLLDKGAAPLPKSPEFDYLLLLAVRGDSEAVAQLLLDEGVKTTAPEGVDQTAL